MQRDDVRQPFRFWDGEGITHHTCGDPEAKNCGCQQSYVLFGVADDNGKPPDTYITAWSLSTEDCFEFMIEQAEIYGPTVINVSFAFSYDVNMIIKDLPIKVLARVVKSRPVWWKQYRIHWIPKKWLQLTKVWDDDQGETHHVSIRIFDVFSFFCSTFVSVLQTYLPPSALTDIELGETVVSGKAQRANFKWHELDNLIIPYWQAEGILGVRVMESYRHILHGAGFKISGWYGPGAVASFIFKEKNIKRYLSRDLPKEVTIAAAHAYAGGRFEIFKAGHYIGPVYSADINSAYPWAHSLVRSISSQDGSWVHHKSVDRSKPMSGNMTLYLIDFERGRKTKLRATKQDAIQPLFYRTPGGSIHFPRIVKNWYWDPEASLVWDDPDAEILEAWEFVPDGKPIFPFTYIGEYYETRHKFKREGNPVQYGLKVGLNSQYGKQAQRVGWNEKTMEPPTWHQLEYAGWLTSCVRAMLYHVAKYADDRDALISTETDAVFSTIPLDGVFPTGAGDGLGQWETSEHNGILYVQSGFYWKLTWDKTINDWRWIARYRGLDPDSVNYESMVKFMEHVGPVDCPECLRISTGLVRASEQIEENHTCTYRARCHRFYGIGVALATNKMDMWRTWVTGVKKFRPGASEGGKRYHDSRSCPQCREGLTFADCLHPMAITDPAIGQGKMSTAHALPWLNNASEEYTENVEQIDREMRDEILYEELIY